MKKLIFALLLLFSVQTKINAQDIWMLDSTEVYVDIVLDSSLIDGAWDVNWGPDDKLWFTDLEYVQRFDPISGSHDTLLYRQGENALGFAIHNDLLNGTPYVFVAYDTSDYYSGGDQVNLYRYEYSAGQLINPLLILTYEHAGEHAGGRVLITPDDKVMITTADYWFGGDSLKGRTLRINFDGTVPADNPIPGELEFTSGHRNPQGLIQTPNGKLYNTEHGQAGSDEINLLVSGGHYGWPAYDADNCIGLFPDSCSSSTYTYISPLNTTVAPPSGADYYNFNSIPEFENSLLVGTLWGSMSIDVHSLDANGDAVVDYNKYFENIYGRIRDITVADDGSIYFIGFDRQDPTAIYHLYNPAVIGITNNNKESISSTVFPNPVEDQATVQWNGQGSSVRLSVVDMNGKVVLSKQLGPNINLFNFSTTDLQPGIYVVELLTADNLTTKVKMVVK